MQNKNAATNLMNEVVNSPHIPMTLLHRKPEWKDIDRQNGTYFADSSIITLTMICFEPSDHQMDHHQISALICKCFEVSSERDTHPMRAPHTKSNWMNHPRATHHLQCCTFHPHHRALVPVLIITEIPKWKMETMTNISDKHRKHNQTLRHRTRCIITVLAYSQRSQFFHHADKCKKEKIGYIPWTHCSIHVASAKNLFVNSFKLVYPRMMYRANQKQKWSKNQRIRRGDFGQFIVHLHSFWIKLLFGIITKIETEHGHFAYPIIFSFDHHPRRDKTAPPLIQSNSVYPEWESQELTVNITAPSGGSMRDIQNNVRSVHTKMPHESGEIAQYQSCIVSHFEHRGIMNECRAVINRRLL